MEKNTETAAPQNKGSISALQDSTATLIDIVYNRLPHVFFTDLHTAQYERAKEYGYSEIQADAEAERQFFGMSTEVRQAYDNLHAALAKVLDAWVSNDIF